MVAAGAAATVRKDGPYVAPRARYPVARDECGRDKRSQQVRDNADMLPNARVTKVHYTMLLNNRA